MVVTLKLLSTLTVTSVPSDLVMWASYGLPSASVSKACQLLESLPEVGAAVPLRGVVGWVRITMVESDDGTPRDQHDNNRILEALIRADIAVLSFQAEVARLQDAFLHLTEEAIRGTLQELAHSDLLAPSENLSRREHA